MNDPLRALLSRRSIRRYLPDQIKGDELQTILKAGQYAPSGMNAQAWKFLVIQSKEYLQKVTETVKTNLGIPSNPYFDAPTLVLVFCSSSAETPLQDVSLSIGNMMIAATSLGIGSCWIQATSVFFASDAGKQLQEELGVASDYSCLGSVVFGYAAGEAPSTPPRKEGVIRII